MKQRNIARLFILALTLVLLWSSNTLPIHSSSQAAQAATDPRRTEPNDQPTSTAVANGKIAFVSNRDGGRPDIYMMNPDGSQVMRLTRADENASGDGYNSPVWSPDGSKIAFAHHRSLITGSGGIGLNEIFVTDSEAGNARLLTPLGGYDWAPAWSPDSTRIALSACRPAGQAFRFYDGDNAGAAWTASFYCLRAEERLDISQESPRELDGLPRSFHGLRGRAK